MIKKYFQRTSLVVLSLSAVFFTQITSATIVVFNTSEGEITVNLFDQSTPKTVANFLAYVNDGSYDNTVIHRSIPNFITQGGGSRFEGDFPLVSIETKGRVNNEPVWSNQRGTIAMAKQAGDPNSATSQWFFNLVNNSSNLDNQNSGFTVFGQVINDSMTTVDNIARIQTCSEIPMPNYDCASKTVPGVENFVTIYNITIIDSSVATETSLSPVKSTKSTTSTDSNSSGGAFSWFALLLISLVFNIRKRA